MRRIGESGWLSFRNRPIKLGGAFPYRLVAFRPAEPEGQFSGELLIGDAANAVRAEQPSHRRVILRAP